MHTLDGEGNGRRRRAASPCLGCESRRLLFQRVNDLFDLAPRVAEIDDFVIAEFSWASNESASFPRAVAALDDEANVLFRSIVKGDR